MNNNFMDFESDKNGKIKRRVENRQEKRFLGMGASSVLVIFIILCLTTFAVLSLISSHNDLRMSIRVRDAVQDYYAADAKTDEILRELDELLAGIRVLFDVQHLGEFNEVIQATIDAAGIEYTEINPDGSLTVLVPVAGERRFIQTDLIILPPENPLRYEVRNRRMVTERTQGDDFDFGFFIFDFDF